MNDVVCLSEIGIKKKKKNQKKTAKIYSYSNGVESIDNNTTKIMYNY